MVHPRGCGFVRDRRARFPEAGLPESYPSPGERAGHSEKGPAGEQMSATVATNAASIRPGLFSGLVQAAQWWRNYKPGWLRADLVAGFTLSAYLLPAGLGDASLA